MERIFRLFNKEFSNMNQAALLLGFFALFSQILGLFRDRFIAHFIGPSPILDTYYAAFRIPDFIFLSFASLVSITVIIPFVINKMANSKFTAEAQKFLNDIFTGFLYMIVLISLIVFIFMPKLVLIIAPG